MRQQRTMNISVMVLTILCGLLFSPLCVRAQRNPTSGGSTRPSLATQIRVQIAPTVNRKDLSEAASVAFIANKLGLRISIDDVISALPQQTTRPDQGWVKDWGFELKVLPEVFAEFGIEAQYRPGLSTAEAASLLNKGFFVMYRTWYETAHASLLTPSAPLAVSRAVIKASSQMVSNLTTVVLLSTDPFSVRLYDPYKGIVTLPPSLVGEHSARPYAPGEFGYSFNLWMRPKYEAVVISPTVGDAPPKPLITTHWSQANPFNALCPTFTGFSGQGKTDTAPAGCNSIAMAQLMAYYKYPAVGIDSHIDPFAFGGGLQGQENSTLESKFSEHRYDWSKILNGDGASISQLVLDCGVSIDTNYYLEASSARALPPPGTNTMLISDALKKYFGYASGGELIYRKSYISPVAWFNKLKQEIDAGRPVIYIIFTKEGITLNQNGKKTVLEKGAGHTVIMDGYRRRSSGLMIHLNFGLGGAWDGYYPVDDVQFAGIGWNEGVRAIVGISPGGN